MIKIARYPLKTVSCTLALLLAHAASAQPGGNAILELPEGDGRLLIESACLSCHSPVNIFNSSGYDSVEEWRFIIDTMVDVADSQANTMAAYLAEHFPADASRAPTLIDGDIEITIREWRVPTLGQRSRDPVEAPDGSIWWTGMWASLLGRLDPATGEMEEYRLPLAARPHTIVADDEGYIWYTGNSNATIGRLDPRTGLITEYPTQGRDPHSAVFHVNGNLYFTSQQAGMIGRLNPVTGEMREVRTESRPYGIKVDQRGVVWIAYMGTNKIAAMDPETMDIHYYEIAEEQTRIRRLDVASDGTIWYVNSTMGRVGRLDPATGEYQEWPSPSGPDSHPYAIAVIDDVVWYNESAMRPDALVRFDPQSESFQSWAIPSGVGIVRNMAVTRDNNLLIHQSSSNYIGIVEID